MNKKTQELLASYGRHLVATIITAIVAIANVTHVTPLNFTKGDWLLVANTLWVSALPVVRRYLNKQDPAFGLVADFANTEIQKVVLKSEGK